MDADPDAPLPWLVTTYVNGPSLAQAVASYGPLPVRSVLALAAGLAEGLSAVHAAGVVHRDLKPANVLLAQDGPRVIDFGISQAADVTAMTAAGAGIGSPGFMSPEQAKGGEIGSASDVFSLGAVLVFAATGDKPFGTGTADVQLYRLIHEEPRLDQLPAQIRPLVERCLAKDPAGRPSATQFLAELTEAEPSAANLTDWLPASMLPATGPLPVTGERAPEPSSGPQRGKTPGEVPGRQSLDDLWPPTVTTPVDHPSTEVSPVGQSTGAGTESEHAAGVDRELDARQAPAAPDSAESGRPKRLAAQMPTFRVRFPAWDFSGITAMVVAPRWRRWGIPIAAAASVLAVILGLLVASPWEIPPPPVLRPTGLIADTITSSSAAFRWSGPATGPIPSRYEILRDRQPVGSVPGNITFYRDTGLTPTWSYTYQVIAVRDGKRSSKSPLLVLKTMTPPISVATLDGFWTSNATTTKTIPAHSDVWPVGEQWSDTWLFTPDCTASPCRLKLSGTYYDATFSISLTRSGEVYAGTTSMNNLDTCGSNRYMHDTMHLKIQVDGADAWSGTWKVDSWHGVVVMNTAPDRVGGCAGETDIAKVSGSQ
jgi:hypothetical protein